MRQITIITAEYNKNNNSIHLKTGSLKNENGILIHYLVMEDGEALPPTAPGPGAGVDDIQMYRV